MMVRTLLASSVVWGFGLVLVGCGGDKGSEVDGSAVSSGQGASSANGSGADGSGAETGNNQNHGGANGTGATNGSGGRIILDVGGSDANSVSPS